MHVKGAVILFATYLLLHHNLHVNILRGMLTPLHGTKGQHHYSRRSIDEVSRTMILRECDNRNSDA